MCLVLVAVDTRADWPLVVAANRDERHDRPADPLHWWPDRPDILAGRDRVAGGTWMGASAAARFACILNDPRAPVPPGAPSRGVLVPDYLECADPAAWRRALAAEHRRYAGFHLLTGDGGGVHFLAGGQSAAVTLGAGLHVIDNAGLDRDDPRSERARAHVAPLMTAAERPVAILDALEDRADPDPGSGVGDRRPIFVADPAFGTRCSTVLRVSAEGRAECRERRFDGNGIARGDSVFSWHASDTATHAWPG